MSATQTTSFFLLLSLLLFMSSTIFSSSSAATSAITQGQLINSSQTIQSPNGIFELGFFSISNSFYLGVWYKPIPQRTIVWVANRDRPLAIATNLNSSSYPPCFLTLNQDGNLVIFSGNKTRGASVALTSISSSPSKTNHKCAMLLDTGNLVLKESCIGVGVGVGESLSTKDDVLWQSFDYPTDTILAGMRIGHSMRTGKAWQFSSWKSLQDPSPGQYSLMLDRGGQAKAPRILMNNGEQTLWTSGPWDGQTFSYIRESFENFTYKFNYISNENERYFKVAASSNTTMLSRIVLDASGKLQEYEWLESGQRWVLVWEQPKELCNQYKYCGANSDCDPSLFPYCYCLQGFEPRNQQEWNLKYWTNGCVRRTSLQCGDKDGFVVMPNVSLPLEAVQSIQIQTDDGCKLYCFKNCSCSAYAYENSQCWVWYGSLYNVRQTDFGGSELSVRLAASDVKISQDFGNKSSSNTSRHKKIVSWVLPLSITLPVLIILSSVFYCLWRNKKLKPKGKIDTDQDLMSFDFDTKKPTRSIELSNSSNMGSEEMWDVVLPFFSFESIVTATNNFSAENKLGRGGFGPVYKGTLMNRHEVAIKRLSSGSCQGLEEFKNETTLIAKLQHTNLVRLLGFCVEGEEKILIYEYMANKSLDLFLFDPNDQVKLTWERRVNIIEGIAQGLLYLHQFSRLRIIHRDLKASNILLDDEMNPKISDFGMARIFGDYKSEANTNRIVGTYGYMSPEYAMGGLFSVKSDVFSFGVLLLEILSSKRNSSFHLSEDGSINLIGHAWNLWIGEREMELIDPTLLGDSSSSSSSSSPSPTTYIHVALLCLQEKAIDRPTMSEVIAMLNSESASLPPVKQPAFSFGSSTEGSANSIPQDFSINNVTLSLGAR